MSASLSRSGKVQDSTQLLKHDVKKGTQIFAAILSIRVGIDPLTDLELFMLKITLSTSVSLTLAKSKTSLESRWEFISLILG